MVLTRPYCLKRCSCCQSWQRFGWIGSAFTIVQLPHQLDVPGTDSITLTDHLERLVSLLQNVNILKANVLHSRVMSFDLHPVAVVAPWPIASICAVMHQTVKVIRKSKVVWIVVFLKVSFVIFRMNVFPEDLNIIVPVQTNDTQRLNKT